MITYNKIKITMLYKITKRKKQSLKTNNSFLKTNLIGN